MTWQWVQTFPSTNNISKHIKIQILALALTLICLEIMIELSIKGFHSLGKNTHTCIMGWGSIVDQNHSLYHYGENNNVVLSRLLLAQNLRGNSFLQGYIIDDCRSCQAMYKELISKKIGAHDIL